MSIETAGNMLLESHEGPLELAREFELSQIRNENN